MKRPPFFEGVAVAAAASTAGAVLFGALTIAFTAGPVLRLLVAGISLAYVIYLLSRSGERVGRIAVVSLWMVTALAIWWLSPSFPAYLLLHVAVIWVVRSLYFHSSMFGSVADLGISVLALAAGISGGLYTGSVFLGLWCFFLTQALFVIIPVDFGPRGTRGANTPAAHDRFEAAHRTAESALRKFSSSP